MLKLNLGCGSRKFPGWVNVDITDYCQPDMVWDLEKTPWPWEDNSVIEITLSHVLEHLGQTSDRFLAIMKELYRISANGAVIHIAVPHPRHDHFINDPTHVRHITPDMLALFDREQNLRWQEMKAANTPLALILNVDFFVENVEFLPDPAWESKLKSGEITEAAFFQAARDQLNVIAEIAIDLVVRKSAL